MLVDIFHALVDGILNSYVFFIAAIFVIGFFLQGEKTKIRERLTSISFAGIGLVSMGVFLYSTAEAYSLRLVEKENDLVREKSMAQPEIYRLLPLSNVREIYSSKGKVHSLAKACGESHPGACIDEVRERTVRFETAIGRGSGGILGGGAGLFLLTTAAHVLVDEQGKLKNSLQIQTAKSDFMVPLVVCTSYEPVTLLRDIAFVYAIGADHRGFELPPRSNPTSKVFVGEFASSNVNVLSQEYVGKTKDFHTTTPEVWAGASGSSVYNRNGGLLGVVSGTVESLTVSSDLKEFEATEYSPEKILQLRCFNAKNAEEISVEEKRSWLESYRAMLVSLSN